MTRIIQIVGPGGRGKSTVALNLGIAFVKQKTDALLLDASIYSPDISTYANIFPQVYLNECLRGEESIENAVLHHPSGLKIVPSMIEEKHDDEIHLKINDALLGLLGKSEVIIVDSSSYGPSLNSILHCSDENIIVSNDSYESIVKSRDMINSMEAKGMNIIGVILNRRRDTEKSNVEAILGKKILAEIRHDERIIDAANKRHPVVLLYPKSQISSAMAELAAMMSL